MGEQAKTLEKTRRGEAVMVSEDLTFGKFRFRERNLKGSMVESQKERATNRSKKEKSPDVLGRAGYDL